MKYLKKVMLPAAVLNMVCCIISYEYFGDGQLALLNFLTACVCYMSWKAQRLQDGL